MQESGLTQGEDERARKALAEAIVMILETWGVGVLARAALLGVPDNALNAPLKPLPEEQVVLERAGLLLAVHSALRQLFPGDPDAEAAWLVTADGRLGERSPVNLMLSEGLSGIKLVHAYVETLVEARQDRFG